MFYPRHTPSMIVNNIPSSTVVQRVTAHRPCITGSYAGRRMPPLLIAVGRVLLLWVGTCQSLPTASVRVRFGFLQYISLDSCTHCAQGDVVRCEAPLAALSLALPDPSQHDRFPSLRRVYITTLRYGACHWARVTEIRASSAIEFEDEGWPRPNDSVWTLAHRCCSRIQAPY
jgi:hypothetical protein